MLGVPVYVVVEAVGRDRDDVEIQTVPVPSVGALWGLVIGFAGASRRAPNGEFR